MFELNWSMSESYLWPPRGSFRHQAQWFDSCCGERGSRCEPVQERVPEVLRRRVMPRPLACSRWRSHQGGLSTKPALRRRTRATCFARTEQRALSHMRQRGTLPSWRRSRRVSRTGRRRPEPCAAWAGERCSLVHSVIDYFRIHRFGWIVYLSMLDHINRFRVFSKVYDFHLLLIVLWLYQISYILQQPRTFIRIICAF